MAREANRVRPFPARPAAHDPSATTDARRVARALRLAGVVLVLASTPRVSAQQFTPAPSAALDTARHAPSIATVSAHMSARASARAAERQAEKLRRRVDFISAKTVNRSTSLSGGPRTLGETLLMSGDEQTAFVLVHRTTPSKPEVHARWDDLIIVRGGAGAIELGDSLAGSTYRAPGERIGGTIVGRYTIEVVAGDMVRIPAAVPHAFIASSAKPLDYLVIKQRQQRLPIRWFGEK